MAGLELRQVKKSFGSVDVIHGVDLDIEDGEFTVFVGPSGCGKSTLLRLVAGLEATTSGTLSIGGQDVTDVEPADRGVAMVFQSYALYPHMTVEENMGFGLKMTGHPAAEIKERVSGASAILHLDPLLQRKPKALSGGQRQRVAIGRAIVRQPEVFLFDEPLSNLDAELRVQMRLEIAKLHKELGATMIYVTHDQVEAMTLADKIVVLRAGIIEQTGSPLTLYDDPDNSFVAGFIGSPRMNFLPATVVGSSGETLTVRLDDLDAIEVPMTIRSTHPKPGAQLELGIRPEHFDPAGSVQVSMPIDVIENLGGSSFAYSRSDMEQPLTIELRDNREAREGEVLKTGFNPVRAFLFDAQSGLRLR
ncbi:sn-glycerol-3-phosphate ABC transporter ATP-binding protein UgpC [Hoeflea sp. G2-23]|uniref:Sn-glycerol-3-phosphate ABC transporter ATP-binding protein UgpC n=1 Tax=Hoeflea algicola TaxID=2983763 RepID=A0ABT3ZGH8_9HYPH|nr:sn-glycerol-3-phosphate ABC transporter ATP-binding protein UgpC [Hoeflea algicola]MCY0150306.1 sn-glycerol-3-phosphate ABC transporter ATP-binding protein UgpC [Hoeflea algicola]